jgi:hypothetical protein
VKLVPDRKGGLFEETDRRRRIDDPIFGFDEGSRMTPGFAIQAEQEVRVIGLGEEREELRVLTSGMERRETITCDAWACTSYRVFIDGGHAPHPAIPPHRHASGLAVPADWTTDRWQERDGKYYCPRHSTVVSDPFAVCSEECGVSRATPPAEPESDSVPEPEDLPVPIALIAASTDQKGASWEGNVAYVIIGMVLATLIAHVVEFLR